MISSNVFLSLNEKNSSYLSFFINQKFWTEISNPKHRIILDILFTTTFQNICKKLLCIVIQSLSTKMFTPSCLFSLNVLGQTLTINFDSK